MSGGQRHSSVCRTTGIVAALLVLVTISCSSVPAGLTQVAPPSWPQVAVVERITGLHNPTYIAHAGDGSGRLWGLRDEGGTWASAQLAGLNFTISTFGQDEAGNVYLADYGAGRILQIVPHFASYLPFVSRGELAVPLIACVGTLRASPLEHLFGR